MSRARHTLIALGVAFAVSQPCASASTTSETIASLSGTWRSAPEEMTLSSALDESVWGKGARAVRTVQMTIRPTGDATLTVNRKVVNARGRTAPASTSIEHADLHLGKVQNQNEFRSNFEVTVKKAERRYPDDPAATWALDGLRVSVSMVTGKPGTLEVRVDTPEGRGSFWETLSRVGKTPSK
jgi:hypothetical protein